MVGRGGRIEEGLECLEHEKKEYMAQNMRVDYIGLMKKRNGEKRTKKLFGSSSREFMRFQKSKILCFRPFCPSIEYQLNSSDHGSILMHLANTARVSKDNHKIPLRNADDLFWGDEDFFWGEEDGRKGTKRVQDEGAFDQ